MIEIKQKIIQTLNEMERYSDEALLTLLMICSHESAGGKYRSQLGSGIAKGIFQMEKVTHDSIWDNSDSINILANKLNINRDFSKLEYDDRYAVFMARCYLLMDQNPLPRGYINTANYCKSYWNRTGDATPEKYLSDYIRYCCKEI